MNNRFPFSPLLLGCLGPDNIPRKVICMLMNAYMHAKFEAFHYVLVLLIEEKMQNPNDFMLNFQLFVENLIKESIMIVLGM